MNPNQLPVSQPKDVYQVRHLQTESEFVALDAIYQDCFGEHSVPTERQKEWWRNSNKNILGLFADNEAIGGISFWNLNRETFEKLKTGQLQERNIGVNDFEKTHKNLLYLSDIAIAASHRKKMNSNLLLQRFFEQIEQDVAPNETLQILAFAFSESGSKILKRLGFVKIKNATQTLDEQDLYLLQLKNKTEIEGIKARIC